MPVSPKLTTSLVLAFLLAILSATTTSPAIAEKAVAPPHVPRITRVHIVKSQRLLELWSGETRVRSYVAAMGNGGSGPKQMEGDGRTPVGRYHVTAHQPSRYEVFLRLDYPTAADWARFAALKKAGRIPPAAQIGGDIGIHGTPKTIPEEEEAELQAQDWTIGCIGVTRAEIREIAELVPDGTIVDIED